MLNRAARSPWERHSWPTLSIVVTGAALFIALGGSAVAANSLIHARDIATGAVTSKAIKNGAIKPEDLNTRTQDLLMGGTGAKGDSGLTGTPGTNGPNGANGANGPNGANGANGTDGTNGTDGIDGTIAPLSATAGPTALPTGPASTTVVNMAVPAGNYVVLGKTQLSQTGAGDSIDCVLKAGSTTIDQSSMKTLPALAAIPVSLQAVTTTTSPSQLSVACHVMTANGSADFSSLIAIPTG